MLCFRVLFRGQWPGLPGEGGLVRYQPTKDRPKETFMPKKKPVLLTKVCVAGVPESGCRSWREITVMSSVDETSNLNCFSGGKCS